MKRFFLLIFEVKNIYSKNNDNPVIFEAEYLEVGLQRI